MPLVVGRTIFFERSGFGFAFADAAELEFEGGELAFGEVESPALFDHDFVQLVDHSLEMGVAGFQFDVAGLEVGEGIVRSRHVEGSTQAKWGRVAAWIGGVWRPLLKGVSGCYNMGSD